jgi:FeS assembly SUF system regulator
LLKISRLADYAGVVAVNLANSNTPSRSAADISSQTHIAYPTVSKVLKLLNEAGLVTSQRGAMGGYALSSPANAITLADITNAIDGDLNITACSLGDSSCHHQAACSLKNNWRVINKAIHLLMRSVTLQHMCEHVDLISLGNNFMAALGQQQVTSGGCA